MTGKQHIVIKGVKDGLLFLFDDQCDFEDLITELKYKIEKTHHQLLSGPLIHITVKLGKREINENQNKQLLDIIRSQGNLMVHAIESDSPTMNKQAHDQLKVVSTIVRSGQEVEFDGDLLLLGDVHSGGIIRASGDIYVLGALKGVAQAGINGREESIIVASLFKPSQLKIASHLLVYNETEHESDGLMEYAYIENGHVHIQKLTLLHREQRLPIIMRGV